MTLTPIEDEKELREKIEDWRIDQHVCDDEGYGCEIEEFSTPYKPFKGFRCKLLRESDDNLVSLVKQDREKAVKEAETEAIIHHNQGLIDYYAGWKRRKIIKITELEHDIAELEQKETNDGTQ